jgi:hypothetical protein
MLFLAAIVLLSSQATYGFRFSVGGFGGFNFPVAQDDAKMGPAFGVRARIPLVPFVAAEPNFTYLKNGDAEILIDEDNWNTTMKRDAGKFTNFGLDVVFGKVMGHTGLNVFGIAGLSASKYARDVSSVPDLNKIAYWGGLGLEYAINEQISLDIRGKLMVFAYDDGKGTGSRKNGLLTFGVNYYMGQEVIK